MLIIPKLFQKRKSWQKGEELKKRFSNGAIQMANRNKIVLNVTVYQSDANIVGETIYAHTKE